MSKKEASQLLQFILFPFAIGALWHAFGAWMGVPALIVFGMFWLGLLGIIYKECDAKTGIKGTKDR